MAFHTTNGKKGFTLIELLVVMAIIATLMTLVAPKYFKQTERAKEVVLQHNIRGLREAIDNYRQDLAAGPQTLDDLVSRRYLKEVPLDPVTGRRDSWVTEVDDDALIQEVRSGAPGTSLGGEAYAQW
ncbi:type II secretion system protein [Glaciimonas immobilis]|uniref:General secretion pathway protein G n=1 Tax=Glaciimonas immobilis TaxID=728004 RepID=A0A840RZS3_9BURK|nr:prepilin-type N-terminal cleavage/methylation domain-containing protein [Glaciimonas immobilis]KAF3998295.1 prepilin-type N-terminal cleavage/methylation domain-containing protein [Glaciimonas immobilis]MBB5201910.1 general secretion pathway protein G [Glaciimonas immobilis]